MPAQVNHQISKVKQKERTIVSSFEKFVGRFGETPKRHTVPPYI
jgi:hypothetical protein